MAASSVLEGPKEIPSIDKQQIIADCKEVGSRRVSRIRVAVALYYMYLWGAVLGWRPTASIHPPTPDPSILCDVHPPRMHQTQALYCSKIVSYAQGMNLIRAASDQVWQAHTETDTPTG